ncbi:MAG: imidazole glycerol phosphate synthase subunit HisH [Ruminococcaceae bacterium]|nr:imidazole glycerol phosphate synthase subunit HisH [Oscillospiraceae bacterium]
MIAIIDYGMGNLASVAKALKYLNYDSVITSDPKVISASSGVILPGVGAFAPAMENLRSKGLDSVIIDSAFSGKPFLGICLGMQLLMDGSKEGVNLGSAMGDYVTGLGIIPGRVRRFETTDLKVPQIGWNKLVDCKGSILTEGDYVYFVHSYYCIPEHQDDAAGYAEYGIKYCCALEHDNVFATQFHPEKSGEAGLQILNKFAMRTR